MSDGEYFLMVMGIGFGLAVPTAIVATLLVQIRDRLDDRPLPPASAPRPVLLAERVTTTVTERIYGQPGALPAAALPAIVRSPHDRPAALIACAPLPVRRPPSPLPPAREETAYQYDADGRIIGWMEEW